MDTVSIDPKAARVQRMRRSVVTTARLNQEHMQYERARYKAAFLTLTYRDDVEWEPRHISELLKAMREWARRRGVKIPYVWVAELTKRGRMHYHILLYLPRGLSIPKPDKRGWWKHGSTNIAWARRAVGYVAKYASKADGSANYPRGARISGFGGAASLVNLLRRWWMLPSWLRAASTPEHDLVRAPGGGFVSRGVAGLVVRSPYQLIVAGSHRVEVIRVAGPPPPLPGPLCSGRSWPTAWIALGTSAEGCGPFSILQPIP